MISALIFAICIVLILIRKVQNTMPVSPLTVTCYGDCHWAQITNWPKTGLVKLYVSISKTCLIEGEKNNNPDTFYNHRKS